MNICGYIYGYTKSRPGVFFMDTENTTWIILWILNISESGMFIWILYFLRGYTYIQYMEKHTPRYTPSTYTRTSPEPPCRAAMFFQHPHHPQ
jgi:hypothetical protein